VFKGKGWDGIDAHWRAKHEDVMSYEEFWDSLCDEHKANKDKAPISISTNQCFQALPTLAIKDLLCLQAQVINELKNRNVVRTKNNPLGDYTEWLVAKALNLELASNSKAGYDGIDAQGTKIQIKGRRITPDNKSRQLSAIRSYDQKDFDVLAAVIFDENYNVIDAVLVPHNIIGKYARHSAHVNAHILTLKGAILSDSAITCFKKQIC